MASKGAFVVEPDRMLMWLRVARLNVVDVWLMAAGLHALGW